VTLRAFRGLDLLACALAAVCERAPWMVELLVRLLPRGRYWVAARVKPSRMPSRVRVRRDGLRFELDPREEVQRQIYFGAFERRELRIAMRVAAHGGTAVDVGANVGYYALALARCVGAEGRVHAFEPDPSLAAHLERHLKINGLSQRQAVGALDGQADFYRADEQNRGSGTLIPYPDLEHKTFPVEVVTLDAFCGDHGILRIDFLKVDVEGAEPDVIRGATGLLDRAAIRHLLVELNGWRLLDRGMQLEDLTGPLLARGYVPDPLNATVLAAVTGGRRPLRTLVTNLLFHAPPRARAASP